METISQGEREGRGDKHGVLIGVWNESILENKPVVYGFIGLNGALRLKIYPECRDKTEYNGSLPSGTGKWAAKLQACDLEPHLKGLLRPDLTKYVLIRERTWEPNETPSVARQRNDDAVTEATGGKSRDRASTGKLVIHRPDVAARISLPTSGLAINNNPRKASTTTPVTSSFISALNRTALRATATPNSSSSPPTPVGKSTPHSERPTPNREKTILTRSIGSRPSVAPMPRSTPASLEVSTLTPNPSIPKRALSQPSPDESFTSQERSPKRLRVNSDEPLDLTTQNGSTPVTCQPDIRHAMELIRQGKKLSDIAIVESLRAIGFDKSEILDPVVTAEPSMPYRAYTPMLADQSFVVSPIYHPEVGHWTVGIAADGVIHHYDSLGDGTLGPEIEQRIKDHLIAGKIRLPKSTWTLTPAKSAQQENEEDCGMFTIINAIYHVCEMHCRIDKDVWREIIRTWRKIFSKILQARIVQESTTPAPRDLKGLGVLLGAMDEDFYEPTIEILSSFKQALADTTRRLGMLENEPDLDNKITKLEMLLSLVSDINIPESLEYAAKVQHELEQCREIKSLTTRTKRQQAVVDALEVICNDWEANALKIIDETERMLLGSSWKAEHKRHSVEL